MKTYTKICLERAEKASPGPWNVTYKERDHTWPGVYRLMGGLPLTYGMDGEEGIYADNKYDLEFIANSRTDIVELARRLEKAVAALNTLRNKYGDQKILEFIKELEK